MSFDPEQAARDNLARGIIKKDAAALVQQVKGIGAEKVAETINNLLSAIQDLEDRTEVTVVANDDTVPNREFPAVLTPNAAMFQSKRFRIALVAILVVIIKEAAEHYGMHIEPESLATIEGFLLTLVLGDTFRPLGRKHTSK